MTACFAEERDSRNTVTAFPTCNVSGRFARDRDADTDLDFRIVRSTFVSGRMRYATARVRRRDSQGASLTNAPSLTVGALTPTPARS